MKKRTKKILFRQGMTLLLLFSVLVQGWMPLYAKEAAENTAEEAIRDKEAADAEQEGSEERIILRTEKDLRQMAKKCTLDSWSVGKTFVLQNNISIEESDFLPIATFGGTLEGNGCTISGINLTESLSPAGLFAVLQEDAEVKDLKVIGRAEPSGEANNVGGIAGINYGRISNCSFQGYVKGENNIGGIAGINKDTGEIYHCTFDGDVLGNHSTGGISGWNLGTISACKNQGDINIDGEDIEYKMTELSLNTLVNINSTENLTAHTDTGGVAGFSEGRIYYCVNEGTVGYPHVGYNVGGIAGRCKQSYIQNCSNQGKILGRKDVGGIAGQTEPLLEVEYMKDKFQILDEELDKFLDLMEAAYASVDNMSSQVFSYVKDVSYYINTARTAAGGLSTDSQEYYDSVNQGLNGIQQGVSDLRQDLNDIDWKKDKDWDIGSGGGNGGNGGNLPGISPNLPSSNPYEDELNASKNAIDDFLGTTGDQASAINDSSREYGDDMKYHMSAIDANLAEAGKKMDQLSQVLVDGGNTVSEDMSAVMNQAKVLRRVISDLREEVFTYEDASLQDVSDEKASEEEAEMGAGDLGDMSSEEAYDTSSFEKGKITRCLNTGTIEADINVGGIVGVMATEYDVDPEDDIEVVGDTSLKVSRKVSVVLRDSRNEGRILAKKDCAGGIVGKAEVGAVISCEGYGVVESQNGNYVGGIAGKTAGTIKSCFAKCTLSGNNYIGGIVGDGNAEEDEESSVSGCYAMVEITEGKQFLGAIAGKDDGMFLENYFVSDTLQGINRVDYHGKAEPLDYETLRQRENMVRGFQTFTVQFVAEDTVLKTKEFQYGQSLNDYVYPEIPEKEGCYAVWDKTQLSSLQADTVITAQYIPYLMSAHSKECRENDRPIFFAEGEFKEEDVLMLTDKTEETRQKGIKNNDHVIKEDKVIEHWVLNIPDNTGREEFILHYLKEDTQKKVNLYVYEDKQWKKVSYEEEGSYYLFPVTNSRVEIIVTK